jgi:hypothetical protein
MSEPIVRLFETEQQAQSAVDQLVRRGYPRDTINFLHPPADPSESLEKITDKIAAGHVLRAYAKVHAEGVRAGRWLVAVKPPFGRSVLASDIMESCSPVPSSVRMPQDEFRTWDDAAPLSSGLSMTVLLKNPAPLSSLLGLGTKAFGGKPLLGGLTGSRFALSSMIGLPLLGRSKTSLSSAIGLPLLTNPGR